MDLHTPTPLALAFSVLVACNGTSAVPDGSVDASSPGDTADATSLLDTASDGTAPTDGGEDGASPADTGTPTEAGTCTVADGGTTMVPYYCDLTLIHVLQHTGGTARVAIQGRVGSVPTCGVIDSIDVMRGSTTLAHLVTGSSAPASLGDQNAILVTADAPAALVTECGNVTTRLTAYGLVVHGRDPNGPFVADCGSAESGSRWPPGTALLCDQNLDQPPSGSAGGLELMSTSFGWTVMANLYLPHAAGTVSATSIDTTVSVVSPQQAPFSGGTAMLSGQTSPGWTSAISEASTGPVTDASLAYFGTTAPFDTNLCPPPTTPGPGMTLPPFFILQATGQGPTGPVQAQILASCMSTPAL